VRYRLVIFDYDGTLADSGQWFADNFNRFAVKHRFRQVTRDELEALRGLSTREVIRELRIQPWRMPFIARDMRRAVAEPGGTPALFPGTTELLERLERAGIRIAVVSSNTEANIRIGLGPVNAARVTAFDCGAAIFGKAKKLKRLTRRTGIAPAEVLCVGDDTRDIEAAHQAGLKVAAVTWGYANERALAGASPDHLVHSIEELAGVLRFSRR
jgi:phosphoglycolate phosphatase